MTSATLDTTTHSTPDTYHELCHAVRPLRIMLEPLNEAWKGQQFHARWGFRYPHPFSIHAPARTRTWDIRLRRPMLYPAELQALTRSFDRAGKLPTVNTTLNAPTDHLVPAP